MPEAKSKAGAKRDFVALAVAAVNAENEAKHKEAKATVVAWQSGNVAQKAQLEQQFKDATVILRGKVIKETVLRAANDKYPDKVVIVLSDFRKRTFMKADL